MKFLRRTPPRLAELGGHDIDQALQVVGGLGSSGPAIGGDAGGVGETQVAWRSTLATL